ncbi:phage tail protein [Polycladidibacter hongkongensis]|uniref:phage tail protein n=1 Tax=Polycladidibacter hongkongensis TaxID=1647556 RepID=UPI0008336014|nr:phage tail protein [Pseudovibrio hongkongensis]
MSLPLPVSATPLMRALAAAIALPDDMRALPERIEQRLNKPADEDLPFLIWEWGLGEVVNYLQDPRAALAKGRAWQRIRGTIDAGHMARNWIGVSAEHEQHAKKYTTLHLDAPTSGRQSNAVVSLSKASSSLRSHLHRLTYNLDHRAFQFASHHSRYGHMIYGADSGILFHPDGPLLSYLDKAHFTVSTEAEPLAIFSQVVVSVAHLEGDIRYASSRLPAISTRNTLAAVTGVATAEDWQTTVNLGGRAEIMPAPPSGLTPDLHLPGTSPQAILVVFED